MWVKYLEPQPEGLNREIVVNSVEKITEHKHHLTVVTERGNRYRIPKLTIKSIGWKNYQQG